MISSSEFEGNKLTTQRQVDAKCSCIANVVGKSQIECETFTSFPGNHPEELERGNNKLIVSLVVLPGQAEVDEAEGPARGSLISKSAVTSLSFRSSLLFSRESTTSLAPVV